MKEAIRRSVTVFIFTLALGLVGVAANYPAFACECKRNNSVEQEFSDSKSVFVAKVIEIKDSKPDAFVTLRVEKMWKGVKTETIVVLTDNRGKGCGYIFSKGERYLVYAFEDRDGRLRTDVCTRTADTNSAASDLKELAGKDEL